MIDARFSISQNKGNVLVTPFTITNLTSGSNLSHYLWDFGNGNNSYKETPDPYIYKSPGIYVIGLTAYDTLGNYDTSQTSITATHTFQDSLIITQIPDNISLPGQPTNTPFKVSVISSTPNQPLLINLFCINSPSTPSEINQNKWNYLAPSWKFLDKNLNVVTQLSVDSTPLYENGVVVAVSGSAEFYFVDSQGTGYFGDDCPLLITATLQTSSFPNFEDSLIYDYPSFSNSKVLKVGTMWWVYHVLPNSIKVTGNYIDQIYNKQYKGIPIPVLLTTHAPYNPSVQLGLSSESSILFGNTTVYELSSEVNISLSDTNNFINEISPTTFNNKNYVFTSITPEATLTNSTVTAQTTAFIKKLDNNSLIYPDSLPPSPYVWISNPEINKLNKILYLPYPKNCTEINYLKQNNILINGSVKQISVPYISHTNMENYSMSGFSGIYGVCIDPRDYSVVCSDAETDRIYRIDVFGNILNTLNFSSIVGVSSYNITPTNISIDEEYNIWVSLYDSLSVIKLDENFNTLFVTLPTGVNTNFFDVPPNRDEYVLSPTLIETDKNNNCWVTYSHPLCSIIVQYDSLGTPIKQIYSGEYSMPMDIAVNEDNNVWISCFHGMSYTNTALSGSLILIDGTTGTLLSALTGMSRPGYMALDKEDNLWFTYSLRRFAFLNTKTNTISSWEIDLNQNIIPKTLNSVDFVFENSLDEDFGGIGVDNFNRLWVIDRLKNEALVLSATPNFTEYPDFFIKIRPNVTLGYYSDNNGITYTSGGDYYFKSAQAVGDWTGNKWYKKYGQPKSNFIILSGESSNFEILSLEPPNNIRKINESFNTAKYYKDLALPENFKNNTVLFDNFFGAVVGNANLSATQDLGQTVYEKIANFTINHSDIDTCNIEQIKSLASLVDVEANNFSIDFPFEVLRFLDISSIPKHKLWGIKDNTPLFPQSIGTKLNTFTDFVTAGTKIILRNKLDASLFLYTVPTSGTNTIYPLSSLEGYGFVQPILNNYLFYNFNPIYSEKYIENIIDWDSEFTTLNPEISTSREWYGDGGVIEEFFRYLLIKGLS
jgi:hypothetical protein